eukprot:1937037-Pyramimonas_sp.AAC.1
MAPRALPRLPRALQEGPKMRPGGPNRLPRGLQDAPKRRSPRHPRHSKRPPLRDPSSARCPLTYGHRFWMGWR